MFSALWTEIKRVHQKVNTTICVTHDQVEAVTLADRVIVMNDGVIEQVGTPNDLYHDPKTRFVAGFIGSPAMNLFPCRLVENAGSLAVNLGEALSFPVPEGHTARYKSHAGEEIIFGIRPEHITEPRPEVESGGAEFSAEIDVVEPMGNETMIFFALEGVDVCARVTPNVAPGPGNIMPLMAHMKHMHLIDPKTDLVL